MKLYKFESPNSIITLETTQPKDVDYFKGSYRITHKSKKGKIYSIYHFDFYITANSSFIELVKNCF